MTALRRAIRQHFHKTSYRYVVMHFDLNRADRRSAAKRDPRTGKLLTRPGSNAPYIRQVETNA